jgi:hypothetical protein
MLFYVVIPGLDPDLIRSVYSYPDPESGSGSWGENKGRKKLEISCFEVLDVLF